MGLSEDHIIAASKELNDKLIKSANNLKIPLRIGRIHSSDVFYRLESGVSYKEVRDGFSCMGVEMESFALFANAMALNKKAACLLTVSDCFETNENTTAIERQNSFTKMMEIALEME